MDRRRSRCAFASGPGQFAWARTRRACVHENRRTRDQSASCLLRRRLIGAERETLAAASARSPGAARFETRRPRRSHRRRRAASRLMRSRSRRGRRPLWRLGVVLPGCSYQVRRRGRHSIHGCRAGALPVWARRFFCLALRFVGATSPSPSQAGQTAYVLLIYALSLRLLQGALLHSHCSAFLLPCVAVAYRAADGECEGTVSASMRCRRPSSRRKALLAKCVIHAS